ncbi:ABC transporter permease [Halorussus gelatinilyticus]|uniref:ABC transporter permease n=1 Tax=Halorussus gelatinilyticus TaxID=2937524 RepID=A0A8U0IK00_9EURY|nr:ABC transporter permease [Halorussus gelatinilyticus]UPW01460.1 ABC transporter permease [Halorussus gelatinilyticus]
MSTDTETQGESGRRGDATAARRETDSAAETLGGRIGAGTTVLAVVSVQLVAFAAALAVGYPGAYAGFAVLSAAAIAAARNRGTFGVLAATLGTVLLVALGLPLLMMVARQDLGLVAEMATDPGVQRALYLSVYAPLLAATASVALGVPLALVLARGFPGQQLVESLVDLPLVVPHSVAGLAILFGFGEGGAFGGVQFTIPIIDFTFKFTVLQTMLGMVLAMTFVSAPFAVNAAREAFESVPTRVEWAARTLGANRLETFRRVTAPLAWRGVLTGGVLAWARAVSEFGAVAIVAYSVDFFYLPEGETVSAQHAPVFIYNTYLSAGLEESGAVAVLLLALSALIFLLVRTVAYDDGGWP